MGMEYIISARPAPKENGISDPTPYDMKTNPKIFLTFIIVLILVKARINSFCILL